MIKLSTRTSIPNTLVVGGHRLKYYGHWKVKAEAEYHRKHMQTSPFFVVKFRTAIRHYGNFWVIYGQPFGQRDTPKAKKHFGVGVF